MSISSCFNLCEIRGLQTTARLIKNGCAETSEIVDSIYNESGIAELIAIAEKAELKSFVKAIFATIPSDMLQLHSIIGLYRILQLTDPNAALQLLLYIPAPIEKELSELLANVICEHGDVQIIDDTISAHIEERLTIPPRSLSKLRKRWGQLDRSKAVAV